MIWLCISVSLFIQLTATVKLVPLQLHERKYISVNTENAPTFLTVNQNLHPAIRRKPSAWGP